MSLIGRNGQLGFGKVAADEFRRGGEGDGQGSSGEESDGERLEEHLDNQK